MEWFIYIGIGLLAGFLAGLFGIGGGLIIIPLLSYAFFIQGFNTDLIMHIAIATSLAVIFFTSISAVIAQSHYSAVNWGVFIWMASGMILGSFFGAIFASYLSGHFLQIAIGAFSLTIAFQLILSTFLRKQKTESSDTRQLPGIIFSLGGIVIGAASSIFGIGGGSLTVPYLNWCRVPIKVAIGTSSACALPISFASTLGYFLISWGLPGLPSGSLGYIYLPALIPIAICSMFFAHFGVKLSHALSPVILKRIFALLLIAIGLTFILR